jgi:hypothetical protein
MSKSFKMMRALRTSQGEQTYVQKSDDWSKKYVTRERLLNNNTSHIYRRDAVTKIIEHIFLKQKNSSGTCTEEML